MSYIGWLGNLFVLAGCWGIGNKWRHAFLLTAIGEVVWIATALLRGQYDLAAICVVFGLLAIRNWWLWGNDEARNLDGAAVGAGLLHEPAPGSVLLEVRAAQHGAEATPIADWQGSNGAGCATSRYERFADGAEVAP